MYVHVGPYGLHGLYSRQIWNLMAFQMYHIQTLVAFFRQPAGRVPPWLRQLDNAYQHRCCAVILLVPFEFTSMNCHTELGHGHPFGALSSSSHIRMRIRFGLSMEVPHCTASGHSSLRCTGKRLRSTAMDGHARGRGCTTNSPVYHRWYPSGLHV